MWWKIAQTSEQDKNWRTIIDQYNIYVKKRIQQGADKQAVIQEVKNKAKNEQSSEFSKFFIENLDNVTKSHSDSPTNYKDSDWYKNLKVNGPVSPEMQKLLSQPSVQKMMSGGYAPSKQDTSPAVPNLPGMDPVYLKYDMTLKPGYVNYNPPKNWLSGSQGKQTIKGPDGNYYYLKIRSDIPPKPFVPYDYTTATGFGRVLSAPTPYETLILPPFKDAHMYIANGYVAPKDLKDWKTKMPYWTDEELQEYNMKNFPQNYSTAQIQQIRVLDFILK